MQLPWRTSADVLNSGLPASRERTGDMKRLRHWLFNFAAGACALLCVMTAVAWALSHFVRLGFHHTSYAPPVVRLYAVAAQ
jgi:hypothetical protein